MLRQLHRQCRSSGQNGSVLSALLIIIAFLSILGGALLNEISGQFLLTQTLANRIAAQATVNASVESSIAQLQSRSVPPRCSTDQGTGVNSAVTLNGASASSSLACMAIIPDSLTPLASGTFSADGTYVTSGGPSAYIVGNSAGSLYNYAFGQSAAMWQVQLYGGVSGKPARQPDPNRSGHYMTVAPDGPGVALVDDSWWNAARRCSMGASGSVTAQPGFENSPAGVSPYFPTYAFFGDESGHLYVYDARTSGDCTQVATVGNVGGPVVAGPFVFTGQLQTGDDQCGGRSDEDSGTRSMTAEIFVVINANGNGRLVHYELCETTRTGRGGGTTDSINGPVELRSLSLQAPVGAAYSSLTPSTRTPIRLAVTSQAGQIGLASIWTNSGGGGFTYSATADLVKAGFGSFNSAPVWCHPSASTPICSDGGGDQIAAGDRGGKLYVLDTSLNMRLQYDNRDAHGRVVPINTTPASDGRGDWYFGANDGYIHDVEPPAIAVPCPGESDGVPCMFQAGLFGPLSPVQSSPFAGGCGGKVCIYFGGSSGSELAQLGDIRVLDLRAHLSDGSGPSLWARVEVGNPAHVGGQGVHILSWSYFNP
jgi:hypothetical protein